MSKTDASTKILGFKYQEMVALKECFDAKDGTKIYLECLGDISDGKISTEVKHSIDVNKKLIDTHIDFWKTLSNIINQYDTFRFYNRFILHTTAKIKEGSIFENWNNSSKSEKLSKIKTIKLNNTIDSYYNNIMSFDKSLLEKLLEKFEIQDNQKTAKEYYQEVLINHPVIINSVEEKNREPIICSLLGSISKELITSNSYVWHIDIDSFRDNFRFFMNQYKISELKFPVSNIVASDSDRNKFFFVKALEEIDYERKIGKSMNYYLRASDSQLKMITARSSLSENLENYDEDIKEIVLDLEDSHIDKMVIGIDTKQYSRRFFDESLEKVSSKTKIEGITETRVYYPKGRLLHNIEIKSININLSKQNESK